jgi:catechol 2,3-dioxygenase
MYQPKLGHLLLQVRDLDLAADFYQRFLKLRLVERAEDHHVFLSSGDAHHDIALLNVGPKAPEPPENSVGLNHVAFEVPDKRSLADAYLTLTQAGIRVTPIDNMISWSLYFDDPDGNGLEIFVDVRNEPHGQPMWRSIRKPLPPERILEALED